MSELGLEDAGVDELSGYGIDIACSAEDGVDCCCGERNVQECGSSDFAMDKCGQVVNLRRRNGGRGYTHAAGSVEITSRRVCRMVCSPCSTSSGSSLPMSLESAITASARMMVSLSLSLSIRASRSSVYASSLKKQTAVGSRTRAELQC